MRHAVVVALLIACSKQQPLPPPSSITTAEGRAQMLAMMKPGGETAADKSIEKLQALLQQRPEKVDAWLALGDAWIVKARDSARPSLYSSAGACAERALALQPENRLAQELQGLVLMNDHRFEEARALMAGVVARSPDHPVSWGILSDALLELGRTPESVVAAQRMMDLKPNLPSYSRAAHLQWLRGDVKAAVETVRLAIDAGGGSRDKEPQAWVIVQAAMIFWNEGDEAGAEAGFDHALSQVPDFPPALAGKGRIAIGRSDGKAAAGFLARAYKASPLVETGWLLGDAREMAGDEAAAQAAWREIEKYGGTSDTRTLALFLATKDREHDQAVKLALEERKTRDDQYTEDVAAWALYRAGRLDEALAASEKATALGTRDARLWYHQGAIRIARGDTARGRLLVERALSLNPHFDRTGEIEARRLLQAPVAKRH